jgi:hypothetical protein
MLDPDGRYLDADERALELLGIASVEELRSTPPDRFAVVPPDPEEQEAFRRVYLASRAMGLLAELAIRRLDGELLRVRTAILAQGDAGYRALVYVVERPTTNLTPRIYRIGHVLAEWRSAERRLVALPPDSSEARELRAEIELLREQHHLLFQRAREHYMGGANVEASMAGSLEHVERTMAHVRETIASAERLKDDPRRGPGAQDRIVLAERQLGLLEAERQAILARDFISARWIHEEFETLRRDRSD